MEQKKPNILNKWLSKWWHKSSIARTQPLFPSDALTNILSFEIQAFWGSRHWAVSAAATGGCENIWYKSLLDQCFSRLWLASLIEDVEGLEVLGGAASLWKIVAALLQLLQNFKFQSLSFLTFTLLSMNTMCYCKVDYTILFLWLV